MAKMSKMEAVEIIKSALGKKAEDKRTKEHKALTKIITELKWDDETLMKWIEEEIIEYESENFDGDEEFNG